MTDKEEDLHALIVAAGKGSRAKLPFPKSLYKVDGIPIILRIIGILPNTIKHIHIVINPEEEELFQQELEKCKKKYSFIYQNSPKGMGDAVLRFKTSNNFEHCRNVLLIWGDVPFIKEKTILELVNTFIKNNNDFAFVTSHSESSYTIVNRSRDGNVISLEETRELGKSPKRGERDIGLFVFKKQIVFDLLEMDLDNKYGKETGEHSFLYIVSHLVRQGRNVEAIQIASHEETLSLNTQADIQDINSNLLKH